MGATPSSSSSWQGQSHAHATRHAEAECVACRGPGYFEMDVDVGSSRSAATAVGLVSGATKSMVIDMGVLLEGKTPEQLPEQLLGTVRFSRLDMKQAPYFDTQTGIMHPPRRS